MKKLLLLALCLGGVATCIVSCTTTNSLYSWYDSENATYQYTKVATEEALTKAMAQYEKVLHKQTGTRGVVPPGMNAEYGYLLCKAGKVEEGLVLLKAEIALYPESEVFISRIIKQLEK